MGFVVFGRESCPYCRQARELLVSHGISAPFYDLTNAKNEAYYMQNFKSFVPATHTTVPIVFFDKCFVGGLAELRKMFSHN
jgi:glutaredoxin